MSLTRIWLAAALIALLALSASRPAPADACTPIPGYWLDRFLDGELERGWEGRALVFSGILEERQVIEGVATSINDFTVENVWKGRLSTGDRISVKTADSPWAPCPSPMRKIGGRYLLLVNLLTAEDDADSGDDSEYWAWDEGDLIGSWFPLGISDEQGLEELLEALDELSERDADLPQYDPFDDLPQHDAYGRLGWPAIGALAALAVALIVYQRRAMPGSTRD